MGGASEHRYLQTLDADLAEAVARAARPARNSPAVLLRQLILDRLQEIDDYRAVLAFRKNAAALTATLT
jgi:hypothetical protein